MATAIQELQFHINQEQENLKSEALKIKEYADRLVEMVERDNYVPSTTRDFIDGFVSRDVTQVSSHLREIIALHTALHTVQKYENQ